MNGRSRTCHPRGSVYVAVLGVASLLTILGISAMFIMRVQQRLHADQMHMARARFAAHSLSDVVLLRLASTANWRTAHANNTWTALDTTGDVSFKYKIVDEIDGNLANDPLQPARIYIWAQCASTVRIYSVLMKPPIGGSNLIRNPDMEIADDTRPADWAAFNATLESSATGPNTGNALALISSRASASGGLMQSLPLTLQSGASYGLQGYLKSGLLTTGRISLVIESSSNGIQTFSVSGTMLLNLWTRISGTVTPTWRGTLKNAYLLVNTTAGTADLRVDDVSMTLAGNGSMLPQPGTWRREILP